MVFKIFTNKYLKVWRAFVCLLCLPHGFSQTANWTSYGFLSTMVFFLPDLWRARQGRSVRSVAGEALASIRARYTQVTYAAIIKAR